MRAIIAAVVLGLSLLVVCTQPSAEAPVTFHGTVIGSDTEVPIAGAVIVVLWRKKYIWEMDGGGTVQRVVESETDAQGSFSVPDDPGFSWNPLGWIRREPWIVIYAPGYRPYPYLPSPIRSDDFKPVPLEARLLTRKQRNDELRRGSVVTLARLPTGRELKYFLSPASIGIPGQIPFDSLPRLRVLINQQRRDFNLGPL